MIKISDLAKKINDELNAYSITCNRGKYLFRIILDTSNYKKPRRIANEVICYIHGILNQVNSMIENTSTDGQNGTLAARLDILVPIFDKEDESENLEIANSVRNILDDYFSKSTSGVMLDETGKTYTFGMEYSLAASGERRLTPLVGDSFTFTSYINYYFSESGINSKSFQISIDGNRIPFTKFGIRRDSDMEGNVPSLTKDGGAQNVVTATTLSLNFDMPALQGEVYNLIMDYVLNGSNNVGHLVEIVSPQNTKSYIMTFSESSLNLETVLNGAVSVQLAEVLTANGVYTYSPAALAYLEKSNGDL